MVFSMVMPFITAGVMGAGFARLTRRFGVFARDLESGILFPVRYLVFEIMDGRDGDEATSTDSRIERLDR